MALIVHKYGGTSMGSTERIRNVARRVAKWHAAGHQVVVVPSAMAGETNRLLGMAVWPSVRWLVFCQSTVTSSTPSVWSQRSLSQMALPPWLRFAAVRWP
jgi:hypothetical protein